MYEKTRILLIPVDYFIYPKITYYKCLIRFNKFGYFGLKDRERSKDRILTDKGKENAKHSHEIFLKSVWYHLCLNKAQRCPKINGVAIVERFGRTLSEECYQMAMLRNIYTALGELQYGLDKFIYHCNFKRTN